MSPKSPLFIIPVLSSGDIERDLSWYNEKLGFDLAFRDGDGYAGLKRGQHEIHLQYHTGSDDDPIFGSVIKIFVPDIEPILEEMVERGAVVKEKLRRNTPWGTHEFGLFDPNKNAIFFVQDV